MQAADRPGLIVIGSAGHASVLVDAIELVADFAILGYLDDTAGRGTLQGRYPVLGPLHDATAVFAKHRAVHAVIAVGDNWARRKIYSDLLRACTAITFPVVRHPSAVVASSAQIGEGSALLAFSHVGPGSRVGAFCILNTHSSLDHDCTLHDFASLAPGAFAGGFVQIGEASVIGVGASISDRISIGNHAVVGTGSAVVRDIPNLVVAYGNPARVHRSRAENEKYLNSQPKN